MLLLRDDWILRDVSSVGPPLVEMPFGGPAPRLVRAALGWRVRIDLHTHSRASDGTQSPGGGDAGGAPRRARRGRADRPRHRRRGGPRPTEAAEALGLDLVTGIEVSTRFEHAGVHLLAYLPDADDPDLVLALDRVLAGRNSRVPAILARLRAAGVELTEDDVRRVAAGTPATGRPHVADALVARGVVADRPRRSSGTSTRAGRRTRAATPPTSRTMVPLVVAAGGVPVVAHPWARSARPVLDRGGVRAAARAGAGRHRGRPPGPRRRRARGAARDRAQPRTWWSPGPATTTAPARSTTTSGATPPRPSELARIRELAADAPGPRPHDERPASTSP